MDWHSLSEKEVLEKLDSKEKGLESKEAEKRLKEHGENSLKKIDRFNLVKVFLEQFKSFLIIILIFAAILSFFMESSIDAIVILAIVVINAALGFIQEYKAEKAIESLKKMMINKVKVIRDSKVIEIDSKMVVVGDILLLDEGDKVVADARVLKSDGLKVNEASLTGESFPEDKSSKKLSIETSLSERTNMVYQGTQVVSGSGVVVVIKTGMNTELGRISELVQTVKPDKNPFKEKLDNFAAKVGMIILGICAIVIFLLIYSGVDTFDSFLVAVSLAVSVIPEGLPAIISLSLAFATKRMINKNVLVRKLPASETLGRTTVICTDKTGTLTEEKMRVSSLYAGGSFNPERDKELLLKIGVLCNNAHYEKDDSGEHFIGDPTETALIVSARDNFIDKKKLIKENPKLKEFPFNSDRKMMSIVRTSNGRKINYVKGAPEKIIERCDYEMINGSKVRIYEEDRKRLIKAYEDLAKKGLRVLGFAYKEVKELDQENAEQGLIFAGLQGMIDPPRKEVKNAIKQCKEAGIKVLMITGDSKLTAEAVAKEIGLTGRSVSSSELDKMSDKELFYQINDIGVFSRISPESKLRLINILKQRNEIVAMTGDGVNDALALKRADIGIAMGIKGTDVAKDSSELILTDDNFASIVEGVKEGRRVYDNVKKSVKYLLSANFAQVLIVLFVMLVWKDPLFLPLLPLQILWINLMTDSLPALALTSEGYEKDIMKRKPHKEGILNQIKGFIIVAGLVAFISGLIFFFLYRSDIALARTIIVTNMVMFQMFLVFNTKSKHFVLKSALNKYLFLAVGISLGLHLLVMYTGLNTLFSFVSLNLFHWIQIVSAGFAGFLIMEFYKYFEREE
jgi:P-type Ca2+ transporter type 2C